MDNSVKKRTLGEFDLYDVNPFEVPKFIPKVKDAANISMIDNDTGEELAKTDKRGKYELTDYAPFVKLFLKEIRSFWNISVPAMRVLIYICEEIKKEEDEILIIMDKCKEFCGYKNSRDVYKGLVDLLEAGVIAKKRSRSLEFFINYNVMFKGNRIKKLAK